jgi:hypothetical protein
VSEALQTFEAAETRASAGRGAWLYWLAIGTLLAIAALIGLEGLGMRFDLQQYDEGVYWATLRAMDGGLSLYDRVFVSQPPLFLLFLYPFYHLFGSTIGGARLALVAFSLLGLVAALLSGRLLAGRLGGLLALLLTMSPVLQLSVPRHLEAEGPAAALLSLGLMFALWWWQHPKGRAGRAGLLGLVGAGVCVTAGVLVKLLDVTGYALLALMLGSALILAVMRREPVMPIIGAGAVVALSSIVTALFVLLPFASAWPALYGQVVQFHLDARRAYPTPIGVNARNIAQQFLLPNAALCVLAVAGLIVAAWRRDVRAVFLGGWLIVSAVLLLDQTPLFGRHSIVLVAPLVGLSMLAIDHAFADLRAPARSKISLWATAAMMTLVTIATIGGFVGQAGFLQSESRISERDGPVLDSLAADIAAHVLPGQWVVTDQQLAADIAGRDTPPWLVDTSWVRIDSGYLSTRELCAAASDTRVAAILFATERLSSNKLAGFTDCVKQQFKLYRDYGQGATLWLRPTG